MIMTIVTLEIPDSVKEKFWIWDTISYDSLIIKTIWKDCISPDLKFISYDDLSEENKKLYDEIDILDKSKLINI